METPRLSTIAPNDDDAEGASSLCNRTNDEVDHSGDPDSKRQYVKTQAFEFCSLLVLPWANS